MLRIKSIGVVLVVVLVTSGVITALASASAPEFTPGTVNTFTGGSGLTLLETSSTAPVDCTAGTSSGEITGAKTVGSVMISFSGCTSTEGSGCSVDSPGAGAGKILTSTLDGELGSVKTTEAESGVGLRVLPTSGTTFATLEGTCLIASPAPIDGSIAGEVTPTTNEGLVGGLFLEGAGGSQSIKKINVLGTTVEPKLLSLGLLASSDTTESALKFAKKVEVVGAKGLAISVAPTQKTFPELNLGETAEETFTYTNKSEVNWRPGMGGFIPEIFPAGEPFGLLTKMSTCANKVIEPTKTCTRVIEFDPGAEGNYETLFAYRFAPGVPVKGKAK